jgi:hypothetical protein
VNEHGGFRSTYQGLGAFSPDDARKPGRNRTTLVVGVIVTLLLVGGGAATVFFLTRDDPPRADDPPKPPPTTATTPATSGKPADGWQDVVSAKDVAAYDVPEDWRVESPEFVTGFEGGSGKLQQGLHGVSTYKPEACPDVTGSIRGRAGFATADGNDPQAVAEQAAVDWAEAAVGAEPGSGEVTPEPAESVEIADGKLTASVVTAEVEAPEGECSAPRIKVIAAAFQPSGGRTVLFVMYLDQGVDDELDAATADAVVRSLRPQDPAGSG